MNEPPKIKYNGGFFIMNPNYKKDLKDSWKSGMLYKFYSWLSQRRKIKDKGGL